MPARVVLVGLGALPPRTVGEVAQGLKLALGLATRTGPPLDRPTYAFNERRGQYHAPAILRRLAPLRNGELPRPPVVALLDGDLFLPDDGEFVLCDADRSAGTAVLALARLTGEAVPFRHRVLVETLSVLGHLLGLPSCPDYRCALFASRDAADADRKSPALCASCRTALEPARLPGPQPPPTTAR